MAAPYIIPFNNQPVQTVASTGSYTVPAGKYALVNISNALLPVLNSVNIYSTVSLLSGAFTNSLGFSNTASPSFTTSSASNVHRINVTVGGSTIYLHSNYINGLGSPSATTSAYICNANTTTSFIMPNGSLAGHWWGIGTSSSASYISSITVNCYSGSPQVWLKTGDVLTYSAGSIVYSEYNYIS